ncbi:MAG: mucoidy inhibitor MuiA family protein, partial [Dysgonomonas sp.]
MRKIKLRNYLSAFLTLFLLQSLNAQQADVKTIKSKLNEATVYLRGAELTHSATATLNKGDNEIRIEGLSPNIDRNSLRIKSSNGVIISSFEFSTDELPLNKPNETRMQAMRDSVDMLTEQLDKVKAAIKIDSELTQLMKKGTDRNIADTIGVNDLMKVMEYYQSKSTEIEMRQITNRNKQTKLEIAMAEINVRLRSESTKKYETSGVLRLSTSAPLATTCSFTISYYTAAARWIPYYDINIKQADKPIDIVAKAKVSQTTTVNWDKVRLTLSTATPSSGKIAPLFNAWFLQYRQPSIRVRGMSSLPAQNSISYKSSPVADEKSLNEVVVLGYGTMKKETSPLYVVNGEVVDEEFYKSIDPASIKDVSVLKDAASTAIYG